MDGPTQEELLLLLQNCDLSGASRPGSALSSRTPSPSPSLMSIMCPGYRPIGANDSSRTSTPIGTPLLRHSNSDDLQQQRQPHTHSLGFLEPGHGTRRSGIFNTSHSLHQVAFLDQPQASASPEAGVPVSEPPAVEKENQSQLSSEKDMSTRACAADLAKHPLLQPMPGQPMTNRTFNGQDKAEHAQPLLGEAGESLQLRKVSSDSSTVSRPVVASVVKRSSCSPPALSTHGQDSALRPVSMGSAISSYSYQSSGSAESDGTLTPHTSRPSSSLSNEQEC